MMINSFLRNFLLVCTVFFFIYIAYMIKKRKLSLKDTLTWFAASVVLIILALFESVASGLANFLHIETPINAIIVVVFGFVLLIVFTHTINISKNNDQIRILTQELALIKRKMEKEEETK